MSARVEAAAKALPGYPDKGVARRVLAAADAVMFDDAAVERAAQAIGNLYEPWDESSAAWREGCRDDVRAVIAALKGGDQ